MGNRQPLEKNWEQKPADFFWGDNAACDHVVLIYDNDEILIDSLTDFVSTGVSASEITIVVTTQNRLSLLELRLAEKGINLSTLRDLGLFVSYDPYETLNQFMREGMPDEKLFNATVEKMLSTLGYPERRIRAFGEMVAILWQQGRTAATIKLERLWNNIMEKESFWLYCAYPSTMFTHESNQLVQHICSAHAKLIDGSAATAGEVRFVNT